MSEAEFILKKCAERQGWDEQAQKAVLLAFIDELGADSVGLLDRHFTKVVGQESDMAEPTCGPPVKAAVSSDDDVRYVTFDAAPWLAQATDEDIRNLAGCHWGGDYPADAVAQWSGQHNPDVARLFRCLSDANEVRAAAALDPIGFECHIDAGQAVAWLKAHRPHLYDELVAAGELPDPEPQEVGYNDRLDPGNQVDTEEAIAARIFNHPDVATSESAAAELGRKILRLVLRRHTDAGATIDKPGIDSWARREQGREARGGDPTPPR